MPGQGSGSLSPKASRKSIGRLGRNGLRKGASNLSGSEATPPNNLSGRSSVLTSYGAEQSMAEQISSVGKDRPRFSARITFSW